VATIADAYVQIIPSAEGISGNLSNILNNEADSAGSASGSKFSTAFTSGLKTVATGAAVAFTAVSTGIAAVTTESVKSYAEYEQLVGGVETLFGTQGQSLQEYADSIGVTAEEAKEKYTSLETAQTTVMENAAEAYKTAGISANDYMEQATSTAAALVSSLGGDTEAAANLADQAIIDMSDNANKMGTSIESIQNAYSGFAKGNFTMLDNLKLGYGGTKEEMERLLEDAEALSGVEYDISSYADITEAIHVVQEEMGIAGTTAKEATETISGSLQMVSASWTNLLTGMSDENADLDSLISQLVDSVAIAADNLIPVVETALTGAADVVEAVIPEMVDRIPSLVTETLPQLVDSGISIIDSIITGLNENADTIGESAAEILTKLTTSFLNLAPELLESGLVIVENLANGIGSNLDVIIPTVTSVILSITEILISHIDELISAGLTIFLGLIDGIISATPLIIAEIPVLLNSLITELTSSATQIAEAGITLFSALTENLPTIIDSIVVAIPGIVDACVDFFTNGGCAQMLEAGYTLFVALISNLPAIISAIVSAIPQIVSSIVSAFAGRTGDMKSAGSELMTSVGDGLDSVVDSIKSSITSTVSGWVSGITSTVSSWKDAGSQLLTGLWNGISDKAQWVYNQITGMGSTIINKVKGIFGIASPSKVFAEIGGYMAEGLGVGWDEEMKEVQNDINGDLTFKTSIESPTVTAPATNTLAGTTFYIKESIDLGDTQLKEIISKYTIQQIGNETRAVKVAQGGFYGI